MVVVDPVGVPTPPVLYDPSLVIQLESPLIKVRISSNALCAAIVAGYRCSEVEDFHHALWHNTLSAQLQLRAWHML